MDTGLGTPRLSAAWLGGLGNNSVLGLQICVLGAAAGLQDRLTAGEQESAAVSSLIRMDGVGL